ncbi:MAG: DNA cytosine methyltransferase [Spirochaetales bacterium]|nr:DNA cytosine methyltransferase [Spirochaetales bacterium]
MKFIDLFAGIGGFRLGMEMAGHELVGWCEIDKFAQKSYRAMYNTKGEWFSNDIRAIKPGDLPDFDCITGGFPCQSFSVAGKRGGFEDTRGTLFFEIARIIRERKPKLVFLENVRGLLNHDGGRTFGTILNTFWELGYDVEWQLLNSKDFGVPHNRERVLIIGYPRGSRRRKIFPIRGTDGTNNTNTIKTVGKWEGTNRHTGQRIYGIDGVFATLTTKDHVNDVPKIAIPVLTPDRINKRQNGRRFKTDGEPMFTLTAQDRHGIYDGYRIRKLTPRECFRLQGFPDELFEKAREVNSDTQLYKQAGNSVTVNVIYEIAKRLGVD